MLTLFPVAAGIARIVPNYGRRVYRICQFSTRSDGRRRYQMGSKTPTPIRNRLPLLARYGRQKQ